MGSAKENEHAKVDPRSALTALRPELEALAATTGPRMPMVAALETNSVVRLVRVRVRVGLGSGLGLWLGLGLGLS